MGATAQMLKLTEAAVVARVTLRDVNRVIDERILPDGFFTLDGGRAVTATACPLISFYLDSAPRLTAEERLLAIREAGVRFERLSPRPLSALLGEDWVVRDEFITIDLASFIRRAIERLGRLDQAREMVVCDPDILGGTPVIRGTRIAVHDIAASIAAGQSLEDVLASYPALDTDKVALATLYAEANPARGRPRAIQLPAGAVIIAERRTPRHRIAG